MDTVLITGSINLLDSCYGLKADELRTIADLLNGRLKRRQKERNKFKEAVQKKYGQLSYVPE